MLRLIRKLEATQAADDGLTLSYDQRAKTRQRVTLDSGREAGLFLERGSTLRDGDLLTDEAGTTVRVRAARESVTTVRCDDVLLLARACYHLGNRHVPVQIENGWIRYRHDHVLDEMIAWLGLDATPEQAPFEPETGAYAGPDHSHSRAHGHLH
jgi:urease accessory protein